MQSLADILNAVFQTRACDFCPAADTLTYLDPETNAAYCLPCLVIATEPLEDGPEDPATVQIGREVIAGRKAARIVQAA